MRIHQLSPHVANQIAAGEVIERPASVVKELLENAVDAGAKTIHIDIGFGGLNLIKVSDNGLGIVKEDLALAIAPHATSKITQLEDLHHIDSMGFRGEALASIASVSRFSLASKPANQTDAMMLQLDDQGTRLLPCARNQGTTVEVADLFYNTPVRKKFLKSERLEFQAIEMVVKRFALSASTIALTLRHQGKEILSLPSASCEHGERLRVKKLLGKTFIDQAIYIETEYEDINLRGWVSSVSYQRSQRDKQWIYLNRRMIHDRLIQHAIQQAYQTVLHPGRFASCVLYLTIPAAQVDVNVHPTKHEVRFQAPRMVHDFIVSSLSHALETPLCSPHGEDYPTADFKSIDQAGLFCKEAAQTASYTLQEQAGIDTIQHQFSDSNLSQAVMPEIPVNLSHANQFEPARYRLSTWYVLSPTFVLVTRDVGVVYLVNVRRAYQALCRTKLMMFEDTLPSRPLLVPSSISIQKKNHGMFEQLRTGLQDFGIHFDFLSETNLLIRTVPQCLPQLNLTQLFTEIEQKKVISEDVLFEMVMACQTFTVYACQEDEKLELLHFIQQQGFSDSYCKCFDHEACLSVMSDA